MQYGILHRYMVHMYISGQIIVLHATTMQRPCNGDCPKMKYTALLTGKYSTVEANTARNTVGLEICFAI